MENRLRQIRQKRGIVQHKLGQVLDLPQSRISDMERGTRKIYLDEAVKLAEFLGIQIEDLIVEKRK